MSKLHMRQKGHVADKMKEAVQAYSGNEIAPGPSPMAPDANAPMGQAPMGAAPSMV